MSSSERSLLHRLLYHLLPDPYWTRYSLWKLDRHYTKQKKSSPSEEYTSTMPRPRRSSSSRKVSRAESDRQLMQQVAERGRRDYEKQQGIERVRQLARGVDPETGEILPPAWLDTSITLKNKYGEDCTILDTGDCNCRECNPVEAPTPKGLATIKFGGGTYTVQSGLSLWKHMQDTYAGTDTIFALFDCSVRNPKTGMGALVGPTYITMPNDIIEFRRKDVKWVSKSS